MKILKNITLRIGVLSENVFKIFFSFHRLKLQKYEDFEKYDFAKILFSRLFNLRGDEIEQIIPQLVSGVKHIHSMGWSHRDIKPANVLVTSVNPIQVALADFGLSKELNSSLERKVDRHGVTEIILTDPW